MAAALAAVDALDAACEGRDADASASLFVDDPDATFWGFAEAEAAVGPTARAAGGAIVDTPGSFVVEWRSRTARVEGDVAWVKAAGEATWDCLGGRRVLPTA